MKINIGMDEMHLQLLLNIRTPDYNLSDLATANVGPLAGFQCSEGLPYGLTIMV
jgi:hypothetical protein